MAISTVVTTALTKWLGDQLSEWMKARKKINDEEKLWETISLSVLKHVKTMADRFAKITTVAFPKEAVDLLNIYVPLTLESKKNGKFLIDDFPTELFEKSKKILLIDAAGMGKSTTSKIMFIFSLQKKAYLPILIDLRRLKEDENIQDALANQFGLKQKHSDLFSEFLCTQPLLYIFDGFDEVTDKNRMSVAREIRNFVDRSEKAKFLITSRPEVFFSDFTDFDEYQISGLSRDQAKSLILKYGKAFNISDRANALLEELNANHDKPIESFLKNPLLTSLIFKAFEFKSVVPVKRGVFYRQVFDALYESHDLSKETGYVRDKMTGLHHDDFHRALRAMAFLFREKKVIEVSKDDFILMSKKISKSLCPDLQFKPEDFCTDVLNSVPLFTQEGPLIRWSHKSIMEYFLAEFLLKDYATSKEDALKHMVINEDCISNENFLVLVNESDPMLYASAVTLPAALTLLERHSKIKSKLPKNLDKDVADAISTIFMSFEFALIPAPSMGKDLDISEYLNYTVEPINCTSKKYFIRRLIFLGEKGAILLYISSAASAISSQIKMNAVPFTRFSQLSNNTEKQGEASEDYTPPNEFELFFDKRLNENNWDDIEDEMAIFMDLLRSIDMKVPTPTGLENFVSKTQRIVTESIKARSDSVF